MRLFASEFIEKVKNIILNDDEFKAILDAYKVKNIAHVATYEKQPQNEKTEIAYKLPACFIDINLTNTNDDVPAGFEEEYEITLHLEQKNLNEEGLLEHYKLAEVFQKTLKIKIKELQEGSIKFDKEGGRSPVHLITFNASIKQRRKCIV